MNVFIFCLICTFNVIVHAYHDRQFLPHPVLPSKRERGGRKEIFYLTTHSTHFIYGYMASDMVKDHSDNERGNPLPPHRLLFPISSKGSFICIIPHTG